MSKLVASFLACALSVVSVLAAPLRRADLWANYAWFVHLDFDALRLSADAQKAWGAFPLTPHLVSLEKETGFVLARHMAGITASGTKQRGQGVLVFRHNFSNEKLIAWFGRRKDVVALSGESFPVQSYAVNLGTALKDANSARKCFLAFPHEGVFVLAWDAESLGSAFTRAASENSPAVVQWPGLYAELGAPASSLLVAYADFSKMSATLESTGKVGLKRMREVAFQAEMKGEDLYARFFAQNATSAIAAEVAELLSAYRPALATHFPSLKVTLLEVMPEDHSRVHLNCSIPISDLLRSPRSR